MIRSLQAQWTAALFGGLIGIILSSIGIGVLKGFAIAVPPIAVFAALFVGGIISWILAWRLLTPWESPIQALECPVCFPYVGAFSVIAGLAAFLYAYIQ